MHDRFSLLLLEEGEYYFMDFMCHYHPTKNGHRYVNVRFSCMQIVDWIALQEVQHLFIF